MQQRARLLLVEDSQTQALNLTRALEEAGFEISHFVTAEAALKSLNHTLPALMIVDLHLPGMRGDEFCRHVRMNVRTRSLPLLMLTANEEEALERQGLE